MSMEMALAKDMTEQQKGFVSQVIAGHDPEEAAIKAGYNSLSARQMAYALLQQPHILGAVQIGVARALSLSAPVALNLLKRIVATEGVDMRLRVVCARDILNRSGHIAPKATAAASGGSVPLNEMSMTDLRALADKLEGEIAGRAKEVSSASAAPKKAQTFEDIM